MCLCPSWAIWPACNIPSLSLYSDRCQAGYIVCWSSGVPQEMAWWCCGKLLPSADLETFLESFAIWGCCSVFIVLQVEKLISPAVFLITDTGLYFVQAHCENNVSLMRIYTSWKCTVWYQPQTESILMIVAASTTFHTLLCVPLHFARLYLTDTSMDRSPSTSQSSQIPPEKSQSNVRSPIPTSCL